jgi:integrase
MNISTQTQADHAAPGVHRVKGAVGLYLKKGEGDAGFWFRRYWFDGKRREMGLGALKNVTLIEARRKLTEFDAQRAAGDDPIELRRATRAERRAAKRTADRWDFRKAAENYLKAHGGSWKHPRARQVWLSPIEKYAYPVIGDMPLDLIGVAHVDAVMTAAVNGGAPAVAPRIRLRIEQILSAATALGKRDATRQNPASVKLIKAVRPTKDRGPREHFRRLKLDDAPMAFQRLMEAAGGSTPLSALCFMVLTAARPSEALNAKWGEIDFKAKGGPVWLNPVSKTDKPLPVPLSDAALAILDRQRGVRTGEAVFPGRSGSPVSYGAFSAAARNAGFDVGSPHSWRSIFADAAADRLGVQRETREAALGHSLGKVEEAYRRETGVEARAVAMQRYSDWLTGKSEDNVVAFPARA